MNCCGKEREGNFCSVCGVNIAPLNGLLKHLERIISQQKSTIESDELVLNKPKAKEKRKLSLAKWNLWRDALVELMESSREGQQ